MCGSTKEMQSQGKGGEEKIAADRKATWESVQLRLPRQKTSEDEERRSELFKKFDQNGAGKLTMEEFYQGCVDILQLDEFTTRLRDIVKRAFKKAKSMVNTTGDGQDSAEFVEQCEFRLMLCYIYHYFALTVMFDEIDTSGNMVVDEKEFKAALPKIGSWGLVIEDPEAAFKEIDDNGSGQVTFDEFAAWASAQKLGNEVDVGKAE
ncbi:hypothetical protein CUR178_05684 [Leishmania enriettii]|uniref:EF-hand domain-containing protein n=1 Tax=Leishmania enriettii TaxID=5663 RepID=A0A836H0K0_LEIEN|nr:hypothetical protein CUR178_05684 [Leishmania enriettii]